MPDFPSRKEVTVCFAHVAYQMATRFAERESGIRHFQAWAPDELEGLVGEADVLVVSGFWRDDLLKKAQRLRLIQSIGAGYDQFPLDELKQRGIRLASAQGVNRNAVSEHAFALILAFVRHIHIGCGNQRRRHWRGMISDLSLREDELGGKTLLIVGMGGIGSRVAKLAKAFDMRVVATKRNPSTAEGPADEVHTPDCLADLLPQADFVVLTCPLTPQTEGIIDTEAVSLMKDSSYLINVARGSCVDETALLGALHRGLIAGAGIDHFRDEPLPSDSPFWDFENVIITPHTAGETRMYEENVIDILLENLDRLWRGDGQLRNEIV